MQIINKFLFLITIKDRRGGVLLLTMMLITALIDMIGVASILPFVTVLVNPEVIESNLILNNFYNFLSRYGVENKQDFIFTLGILFFFILIISLAIKAFTSYLQIKFVLMREYIIGRYLVVGYLHQPYAWFLNRNSSEIGKTILSEVGQVISNGLTGLMDLISKSFVVIAIVSLLLLIDVKVSLMVSIIFFATYGLIYYLGRSFLKQFGEARLKNNNLRFLAISETFRAAKEVKLNGLEQYFANKFSLSAFLYARTQTFSSLISQLPRLFIEAVLFGGI